MHACTAILFKLSSRKPQVIITGYTVPMTQLTHMCDTVVTLVPLDAIERGWLAFSLGSFSASKDADGLLNIA